MRQCPCCQSQMQVFHAAGLELDVCPDCRGVWFDGGELEAVVPPPAVRRLFHGAQGRPGRCRGCGEALHGVAVCPSCRRAAPTCPECGNAPLVVATVRGVEADLCLPCQGIWLDAGELREIVDSSESASIENAAQQASPEPPAPEPDVALPDRARGGYSLRTFCESCQRELRKSHALADCGRVYCRSCAPAGATPLPTDGDPSSVNFYAEAKASGENWRGQDRAWAARLPDYWRGYHDDRSALNVNQAIDSFLSLFKR